MREISEIRKEIDSLDEQMISLFVKRMEAAAEATLYKMKARRPIYVPEREQQVLAQVIKNVPKGMKTGAKSLFTNLMRITRQEEYKRAVKEDTAWKLGAAINEAYGRPENVQSVIFAGSASSYGAKAAKKLFPKAKMMEARGFEHACQSAAEGKADAAVLPFDNTTAGSVNEIDTMLLKYKLSIFSSTVVPIENSLMGIKGTDIGQIREVRSHPQALMQCDEFIKKMGWSAVPMDNTAFAAEYVAKAGDPAIAAIGSNEAAEMYGLRILKETINDTFFNRTRFVAAKREMTISANAQRVSIAFKLPHTSGTLAQALSVFADAGLNLMRIQSLPIPEAPWEYCFYLDFRAPALDEAAMCVLYQMDKEAPFLHLLGWYEEE
ncbi:MAG: prephenate dehydratase domain-containing protein [Bacillota bacterium]|nr:prephenate dehydratase domain-containing protein [Bacillota bacterium]